MTHIPDSDCPISKIITDCLIQADKLKDTINVQMGELITKIVSELDIQYFQQDDKEIEVIIPTTKEEENRVKDLLYPYIKEITLDILNKN